MTSTTYNTIKNSQSIRLSIEKCRFWAFISPVSGEEEAKSMRDNLRGQYPDATHHIFAYRLLLGGQLRERSNDDGEPTGTAGLPVLEALRKKQLVNLQLVVIRYFGGIKLGKGGLIRAYRSSAETVIDQVNLFPLKPQLTLTLQVDYANLGEVMKLIPSLGGSIIEVKYSQLIYIRFKFPAGQTAELKDSLQKVTRGQGILQGEEE